jgi:Ca-activated chloride channel family protein
MLRRGFFWFAMALFLFPAFAQAQGVLIVVDPDKPVRLPRPIVIMPHHLPHPMPAPVPISYKIKDLDIQAKLVDQVAQVQVAQTFVNTGSQQMEVSFMFPLPYDGAIEQMTLLIDGKEFPAKLLDAKEARRMYEEIVRKNRDPALLEWVGTGVFKTSVFPVPPGQSRTVSLRYSQLLRKQEGLTDFLFPLSTAKYTAEAPEKVSIRATIESQEEIKNVYSPSHPIEIKRPDEKHAVITYTRSNEVPGSDFRLLYDIGKGKVSTRVLSYRPDKDKEGFFLLLASPEIKTGDSGRAAKTVVFAIDRSGSMSGKKIEQVKASLKYVLNNLHEGDTFNIIAFDSTVETFRPELQRFNDETRKAAIGFVEGLYAGGSTNIDGALKTAFAQIQDSKRPNYLIFLTDGLPTAGVTAEPQIVANAKGYNTIRTRLFAFGVGYDLNSRLLDNLVRDNFGQSEFVRPNEDIEEYVSRLYRRIESPVLTGVRLQFVFDEHPDMNRNPINRVYPRNEFDLFSGEQLVLVGRYGIPGVAKVVVQGKVGESEQKFDFPATFVEKSDDESFGFIEKLWAVRRVGEILDELDLKGRNDELVRELVELATRHGILTPYTSFMADENVKLHEMAANSLRAAERLVALNESDGQAGVAQRSFKGKLQNMQNAPMSGGMGGPADKNAADAFGGMSAAPMAPGRGLGHGKEQNFAANAKSELASNAQNVRNVGNRTFYQRNGQWIDSQVTKNQQENAKRIKQFSDEYFELARKNGKTISQYLVFDEPVLLNLDDQAYLIEP